MRRLTLRRIAFALLVLGLGLAGVTLALVVMNWPYLKAFDDHQPIEITMAITFSLTGWIITRRRPDNTIGWLFIAMGIESGILGLTRQYYARSITGHPLPLAVWAAWLQNWFLATLFPAGAAFFTFLLFPDGHLPSRRWRPVAWLAIVVDVVMAVVTALDPTQIKVRDDLPGVANPTGVASFKGVTSGAFGNSLWLVSLTLLLLATISVGIRLRRARGEQRQQLKWFAYVGVATVIAIFATVFVSLANPNTPGGLSDIPVIAGFGITLPIACGIAIFRYGLFEIDTVISKTVVVGVLAAFITAIYFGLVVGVGAAIGSKANLALSILATAIVAVAFQPARNRARRLADRVVYGKRATPYEVLSEFSERMGGTFGVDDILPRMARVMAEGTGARTAEVWLAVGQAMRLGGRWPESVDGASGTAELPRGDGELPSFGDASLAVPVRHQGELLGALVLDKAPSDPITPAETKLVQDLAAQAGLVLRNARLTAELVARLEELQASRQRIVAAGDEARRRLERNLHDGAQQQLVAMALKLRLANSMTAKDAGRAREMLTEIEAEMTQALEDLRDLARGIYPPLLADQGLVAAIQSQARKAPIEVRIEADEVGRYSQEAEAAVYFCVLEALQNASKYSAAQSACVRLAGTADELHFDVIDEGQGFDPATVRRGAGTTNMHDRLSAVGGTLVIDSAPGQGTTVTGRIPAAEPGRA